MQVVALHIATLSSFRMLASMSSNIRRTHTHTLLMSLLFDQFDDAPAQVQMTGVVDVRVPFTPLYIDSRFGNRWYSSAAARTGWSLFITSTISFIRTHWSRFGAIPFLVGFGSFLILQLEPFAKVHAPEWSPPMCDHNLTSRSTSSNCCTTMFISVRNWQKHTHLHTNTNSCTYQIFRRLRSLLQYKHSNYKHKNWHSQNCTKHDDKKKAEHD